MCSVISPSTLGLWLVGKRRASQRTSLPCKGLGHPMFAYERRRLSRKLVRSAVYEQGPVHLTSKQAARCCKSFSLRAQDIHESELAPLGLLLPLSNAEDAVATDLEICSYSGVA